MSNFLNGNISSSKKYSRQVLIDWIKEYKCRYAITLVFNQDISLEEAVKGLKKLFFRFDKAILGRKAYKKPSSERSFFFAFPEHLSSNLHFHIALLLPQDHHNSPTLLNHIGLKMLEKEWFDITNGRGNINCIEIIDDGWAHYITKEIRINNYLNYELDFFLSTDFHHNDTIAK